MKVPAPAPPVLGAAGPAMPGYPSGMTLTIQGLSYSVLNNQNKKETLYLLKDVTGFFRPQEMAALMGPSGSGKTTLLDLLAGRKTVGSMEGSILFAGHKPTRQFLRKFTGYVEQFDTLLHILTVEEMMLYTAELKRPRSEPLASKKAAVDTLLEKLGLTPCRHVKIGNPLEKGISGGQAKRVNIGISLITSPRVLFLDEPTSGLDSFTANEVMTTVKALVTDGVTMVATIHSPTAYSFSLFDSLMMLVRGRTVYFGKPGDAAVSYVRALHGAQGITLTQQQLDSSSAWSHNAAEWMVDVFTQADREGRGGAFADAYEASTLKQAIDAEALALAQSHADLSPQVQKELATRSETVTPWWWGLKTLVKYRTTNNYTSSAFLGARIGDKVLMGLLIMTLYLGIGDDFNAGNYINMAAVLFMWITMPAFGAAAYVPSLVLERNLFARERNDGLYRVFTYLGAKMFDELAINLVVSLPVVAAAFYGIRLQGSFVLFWLVYYMTLCVGIVLAYFVAALAPSMDVANAALPVYVSTLLYFGGFLFTFSTMPPWWKWYSFINPLRYSWTAVMINQFEANDPVWLNGQTVLEYYGIAGQSKWANFGYVACFFWFFMVCAWATLSFKNYQKR
ncbi:hypothetical protein OEZ85_006453 [Tetradesmus obliquus]|uniref:ABC transporter domain-containing protein n=1 Tax=Tetradesmus obliquus TaxID=3088 RepID=A0ABY8TUR6_TETOB|nr:hypothetical protein OEZ85_006453 [Tetradesmus obliquus]